MPNPTPSQDLGIALSPADLLEIAAGLADDAFRGAEADRPLHRLLYQAGAARVAMSGQPVTCPAIEAAARQLLGEAVEVPA